MKKTSVIVILILTIMLSISYFFGFSYDTSVSSAHITEINYDEYIEKINNEDVNIFNEVLIKNKSDNKEYSTFFLKRLFVYGQIKNSYGAIDIIEIEKDFCVLLFNSEEETEHAYNKLIEDEKLKVEICSVITSSSYTEVDGYKSWGAECLDVYSYANYLNTNNSDEEVVVVVMDSGINTSHEKFKNRILTDDNGDYVGYSFKTTQYNYSGYTFEDDFGHGTHVAGIICDLTPENVKILPIKVLNYNGMGDTGTEQLALQKVYQEYSKKYNICAVNMSFGVINSEQVSSATQSVINNLYNSNILCVAAMGNEGLRRDNVYPACYNNVIGVSSIEDYTHNRLGADVVNFKNKYQFAYASNFGSGVDLSAPGEYIESAGISNTDSACENVYIFKSGTSMAAPHVAAQIALLCCDKKYYSNSKPNYTAIQIENLLYDNSVDYGENGWDERFGHGVINLSSIYATLNKDIIDITDNAGNKLDIQENQYIQFENNLNFKLDYKDESYNIYYTLDGSTPDITSNLYTGVIYLSDSKQLRAIAIKQDDGIIISKSKIFCIFLFDVTDDVSTFFPYLNSNTYNIGYEGFFKQLEIPETVNGISFNFFVGRFKYSNVERVILPSCFTSIGQQMFAYCDNLKFLYGPNVTFVGDAAFRDCCNIVEVTDEDVNYQENKIYLPLINELDQFSFYECTSLINVNLSKVDIVGPSSFTSCINLKNCNIPSISSLGSAALSKTDLESFYIGENLQTINIYTFSDTPIKSFSISENNKYLYSDGRAVYNSSTFVAFAYGNNEPYEILSSVTINNITSSITNVISYIFIDKIINEISIPDSIVTYGYSAFKGKFNKITLIDESYQMTSNVFYDASIDTLILNESVKDVSSTMFKMAEINNLIIKNAETSISDENFQTWTGKEINNIYFDFSNNEFSTLISNLKDTIGTAESIYSKVFKDSNYFSSSFSFVKNEDNFYIYYSSAKKCLISIDFDSNYGNVYPNNYQYNVNFGQSKKIHITVYDGYTIDNIYINKIAVSEDILNETKLNNMIEIKNVTDDILIEIAFVKQTYSVSFVNYDNTVLQTLEVSFGVVPQYSGEIPIRIADNQFTYTFAGWDKEITAANKDEIYKATYSTTLNSYTVIWNNHNGDLLEKDENVFYGDTPIYNGENPTKDATEKFNYTFVGWSPEIGLVTNNVTYTAQFEEKINELQVTALPSVNGTIFPEGITDVLYGEDLVYTFTPNVGYKIKDVKIDGVSVGAVDNYTFDNVNYAHTISVEYEIQTFNITISIEGNGYLETDKVLENINYGEDILFEISAEEGCELYKVYINGNSVEVSDNQLIINDIKEDISIKAIFKEKEEVAVGNFTTKNILIITVIVVVAISIIVLIKKAYNNSKTKKSKALLQNQLTLENKHHNTQDGNTYIQHQMASQNMQSGQSLQQNSMLQKALEFVKGKESHFVSFCNMYNIDYRNDYNNAVLRYYQAYLRSINSTQSSNDNNK